ncbi:MAG: hypothetical protein IKV03_06650 [Alphaproteobacteria bacterium]|nr:hypothetical protein [Alphaproteobacteria bacterium]
MLLNNTLRHLTNQTDNTNDITFYHVSTSLDAKDSFINEGAKPIGFGQNGQDNGFYVFPNEQSADQHIHFLNSNKNHFPDTMIVSCKVPISELKYPQWQYDYEIMTEKLIPKIKEWAGDFIDKNGKNLNINPTTHAVYSDHKIQDFFTSKYSIHAKTISKNSKRIVSLTSGDHSLPQLLIHWLCKECPGFKEKYNEQMQLSAQKNRGVFKYCGEKPLTIHKIQHAHCDNNGNIDKQTIYTKTSTNTLHDYLAHKKRDCR